MREETRPNNHHFMAPLLTACTIQDHTAPPLGSAVDGQSLLERDFDEALRSSRFNVAVRVAKAIAVSHSESREIAASDEIVHATSATTAQHFTAITVIQRIASEARAIGKLSYLLQSCRDTSSTSTPSTSTTSTTIISRLFALVAGAAVDPLRGEAIAVVEEHSVSGQSTGDDAAVMLRELVCILTSSIDISTSHRRRLLKLFACVFQQTPTASTTVHRLLALPSHKKGKYALLAELPVDHVLRASSDSAALIRALLDDGSACGTYVAQGANKLLQSVLAHMHADMAALDDRDTKWTDLWLPAISTVIEGAMAVGTVEVLRAVEAWSIKAIVTARPDAVIHAANDVSTPSIVRLFLLKALVESGGSALTAVDIVTARQLALDHISSPELCIATCGVKIMLHATMRASSDDTSAALCSLLRGILADTLHRARVNADTIARLSLLRHIFHTTSRSAQLRSALPELASMVIAAIAQCVYHGAPHARLLLALKAYELVRSVMPADVASDEERCQRAMMEPALHVMSTTVFASVRMAALEILDGAAGTTDVATCTLPIDMIVASFAISPLILREFDHDTVIRAHACNPAKLWSRMLQEVESRILPFEDMPLPIDPAQWMDAIGRSTILQPVYILEGLAGYCSDVIDISTTVETLVYRVFDVALRFFDGVYDVSTTTIMATGDANDDIDNGDSSDDASQQQIALQRYWWKTIRHASALLLASVSAASSSAFDSVSDVRWTEAASRLRQLLYRLRHWGAVKTLYACYRELCQRVGALEGGQVLLGAWFKASLDAVTAEPVANAANTSADITRMDARNSGMALALIAVLSSPHPSTSVYLQRTRIDHMMSTVLAHAPSIAFTSASTSSPISISTSTTTIHIQCLSVLQHLYNDAEIAPHLTHYIPPSFNVTIAAFAHASAIVVNAGSQLLVVLAQHVVRGSSTARELFGRMPELERVVRWCLSDSGESATDDAVYGVLSLLVQLEKDDQSCGQHAQGTLWNEWRDVLLPLVGHRSWNIRMAASRAITRFLSSEDARALLIHAANELSVLGRTQRWNAIHGHLVLTHELLLSFSHEPAELTLTVHTLHVIVQRASRLCHFPEVVLIAAFEVLDCLRLLGVFDTTATYDFDGETKTSCSAAYRYLANCTIAGDIVDCKTTMRRLLKRAIDRSDNSAVEAVATALLSSPRVSDKEDLMYYGLEEACTHMIMRNVEANCMLFHTGLVALLQVLAQSEYRSSHSFVSLTRDVVLGARNTVRLFNQATVERSLEVLSASVEPPDGVLFLQLADHYSMSVLSQARIINKHARNGELRIHPHIWQRVVDLLLECDHAVGDDDEPRHAATLLVRLVGDRLPGSAASASRSTDARHAIHAVVDYLTDTPTNMENLLWWIIDLDLRHDLRPFANGQPFLEREPLAEWQVYFAGAVERIVAMQGSSDAIDACQRRFRDMIKRHREWLSQQCCSSKDDDDDQSLLSKQRHTYHHFLDRYEREVLAMLGRVGFGDGSE